MITCGRCGKQPAIIHPMYGAVHCADCQSKTSNYSTDSWTEEKLLKSRTLMQDGRVLTGMAGIRERDRRLRQQEKGEKYKLQHS